VLGEGPVMEAVAPTEGAGFNEGKNRPFSAQDVRFTTKDGMVYAFVMGWPENGKVSIKSMAGGGAYLKRRVARVELAGRRKPLAFRQDADGLHVTLPSEKPVLPYAFALKVV
jgi:alpha-L-fucosidase